MTSTPSSRDTSLYNNSLDDNLPQMAFRTSTEGFVIVMDFCQIIFDAIILNILSTETIDEEQKFSTFFLHSFCAAFDMLTV